MLQQRSVAGLSARCAAHLRCRVCPTTPGPPGGLSPTAATATSASAGRTGRQTAGGRAPGARAPPGRLRSPGSRGSAFGPVACQRARPHELCRARPPAPASASSAVHTAHERVLPGPDGVGETSVVVSGVFSSGATAPELARTVPNAGADPGSWFTSYRATRAPSDGSRSDSSYLDDGCVARVAGAGSVP